MPDENDYGLMRKYFVLNPTKSGPYGSASRNAILEYARCIKEANPMLGEDLLNWILEIQSKTEEKRY